MDDEEERERERAGVNLLCEGSGQSLLAAHFLCSDETVDSDSDGTVDILRSAIF